MNYNQNTKLAQITSQTLIVGVDIAKHNHVARAQDFRGIELGSSLTFENTKAGFNSLLDWIQQLLTDHNMNQILIGMEPTGHYWLNLAHFLTE
ncbi:Transposase [Halobacillus karajensis]|nr:Transposase [Halobacillus karajensis]